MLVLQWGKRFLVLGASEPCRWHMGSKTSALISRGAVHPEIRRFKVQRWGKKINRKQLGDLGRLRGWVKPDPPFHPPSPAPCTWLVELGFSRRVWKSREPIGIPRSWLRRWGSPLNPFLPWIILLFKARSQLGARGLSRGPVAS